MNFIEDKLHISTSIEKTNKWCKISTNGKVQHRYICIGSFTYIYSQSRFMFQIRVVFFHRYFYSFEANAAKQFDVLGVKL